MTLFYPTREQIHSIPTETTFAQMTKAQQQRTLARRREAELLYGEATALREKGLNTQAALLEKDAKRYDELGMKAHWELAKKIARVAYGPAEAHS